MNIERKKPHNFAAQLDHPSRKLELHFAWLGLAIGTGISAAALIGVPGLILPIAFLAISFLCVASYVWVMLPNSKKIRFIGLLLASLAFGCIGFSFWNVFTIQERIRFVNAFTRPDGAQELDIALELINRGKATSLRNWKATLVSSSGKVFEGEPLNLHREGIRIEDASHRVTWYALPDCDLRFETARALQSGDAVYGIMSVEFPSYPQSRLALDSTITLTAVDMLGRTISSGPISLTDVNLETREPYPCKEISPPDENPKK